MSSGSNGLRLRSHLAVGWMSGFCRGTIKPSANAPPPSTMMSSQNCGEPHTRLESVHLLLPLSRWRKRIQVPAPSGWFGWKARVSHPSKLCRATSAPAWCAYSAAGQAALALHTTAVLQVFQAKMLASEEAVLDAASLRDLLYAPPNPPLKPLGIRYPAWWC